MDANESLTVVLVYFLVSVLIFVSGFPLGNIDDISFLVRDFLSLFLLVPLFFWYERYKLRSDLSSQIQVEKSLIWIEVLGLFLLAMAVRIPMVLVLGMAYEKTAVVYLVVLTVVLVKRNRLGIYGFRTERFARSLLVGLAYYLAFAVPLFVMFFGLTYAFAGKLPFTSYDPLPDLYVFPFMTFCVGVSEEGLFRGFMQTRLSKVYSEKKALWTQALLFGIWHFVWHISPFNPSGMIAHVFYTFIFGLVFGYFYKESGNLLPLILAHGLVDTVFAYGAVPNPELEQTGTLILGSQALSFVVAMTILALCTKYLAKKARFNHS